MPAEIEQYIRFEFKPAIEVSMGEYSSKSRAVGSLSQLDVDFLTIRLREDKMSRAVMQLLRDGALKQGPARTINIGDMIVLPNCTQVVSIQEARDGFLEIRYVQVIE